MKKQSGKGRLRALLCLVSLMAAVVCGQAFAEKDILDAQTPEPSDGCTFIGVEGGYATDVGSVLVRMNEIRYEACEQGVPDPGNPERTLTLEDYVPIRWSADLEQAARIRASEASFIFGHERHNGKLWTTASGEVSARNESIAWNYGIEMVVAVDQWYGEKDNWVNQVENAVTGHYTAMIDPRNTYVGLAGFYSKAGLYGISIVGRFSDTTDTLCEEPLPMHWDAIQLVDVKEEYVSNITPLIPANVIVTSTAQINANCTFTRNDNSFSVKYYGPLTYTSSNTAVATIDADGVIHGISVGAVTVTVSLNGTELRSETVNIVEPRSMSQASFSIPNETVTYTGADITNKPTSVKWGGNLLKEGVDYTVSYRNNRYPGTATVVVTGMGIYQGTKEKTFTIRPKDISGAFSFGEVRAILTDEITLQFLVLANESKYSEYTDADPYVTVTVDGKFRKNVYLKNAQTVTWNNKEYYIIPAEVCAKEISDTICLQPYVNPGVKNTSVTNYTVKTYCSTVLDSSYTSEEDKEVVRALLTYCAYARVSLNYKAQDVLASDYAMELPAKEDVISAIPGEIYLDDRSSETDFEGMSLMLLSKVGMRYYFSVPDRVLAYGYLKTSADGRHYMETSVKGLWELDMKVSTNVDNVGISASPLLYIKNVLRYSNDEKLVNLCLAMYNFYEVIKVYH